VPVPEVPELVVPEVPLPEVPVLEVPEPEVPLPEVLLPEVGVLEPLALPQLPELPVVPVMPEPTVPWLAAPALVVPLDDELPVALVSEVLDVPLVELQAARLMAIRPAINALWYVFMFFSFVCVGDLTMGLRVGV
jgi:hypothetical protein